MSFMEFLAQSRRMALPDARTMLALSGIDPKRPRTRSRSCVLTKAMKKAAERTPSEASKATAKVSQTTGFSPRKPARNLDARSGKL